MSGSRLPDGEFRRLVDEARDRHLLSSVVERHTTLRRRGNQLAGLCPFHQERTPSFEVNDARGFYYCHGCGEGGDVFRFLQQAEGMSFRAAFETLSGDAFPVISPEERAQRLERDEQDLRARIEWARSVWARSVPAAGTPAARYARSRGITIDLPPTVRFVMTPRWVDLETGETGREYPAMVCALQDRAGRVTAVQCVFLWDRGASKWQGKGKAKLTFGSIVGSALRLGPVRDHLVVVEGPEDGLTLVQLLPESSVWVACGTALMPRIEYPEGVSSVCFAGDNGNAGHRAVEESKEAALAAGLLPSSTFPDRAFKDWNDQLQGKCIV